MHLPNVFAVDQNQQAKLDHVPWGAVLVAHQVQRHGHVGVAVVAAEVMLTKTRTGGVDLTATWLLLQLLHLFTILCLYSSEASCTAVSQALEPLAYTLLTSSIQYLQSWRWTWKDCCNFTGTVFLLMHATALALATYFVGLPKAMLSSCEQTEKSDSTREIYYYCDVSNCAQKIAQFKGNVGNATRILFVPNHKQLCWHSLAK